MRCRAGDGDWDAGALERMSAEIGGILRVEDQVKGVMGLISEKPANGAVLRVTLRKRGTVVAHDLVSYGRDQGGPERARPGIPLFAKL